jgi:hypothetical protein
MVSETEVSHENQPMGAETLILCFALRLQKPCEYLTSPQC